MATKWIYMCTIFLLLFQGYHMQLNKLKTIIACQGSKVRIRCKSSKIIMIYHATYGRTLPEVCSSPNIRTLSCSLDKSKALQIVQKRCSYRSRCNVKADSSTFPDPCPDTFKHMSIIYWCKERPPNMTTRPPSTRKRRRKTTSTTPWTTAPTTTPQPTTTITTTTIINTTHAPNITHNITSNYNTTTTTTTTIPITLAIVKTDSPVVTTMTTAMGTTTTQAAPEASGYVNRGQPKYVLILFLSGVAIATVLLLVLLLGLHIRSRRSKKFEVQTDKPLDPHIADDDDDDDGVHDDCHDDDDDDTDDENKNVTIEIQGGNEETKQISVKPGDIIIIDSKDVDNDDSEDLGYMSEIVRYYNSRNMVHDDGKQSLTCETPSVNSIPNSDSDKQQEIPYETVRPANGVCVI